MTASGHPRKIQMIRVMGIVAIVTTQLLAAGTSLSRSSPQPDVQAYVLAKLAHHHIVFMGTVHQQPVILRSVADLIPRLHEAGVTHLALEIADDQQPAIDRFMASGRDLNRIRLHAALDCPDYRHLFQVLRRLEPDVRPAVTAIDLPVGRYGGATTRDAYMAGHLAAIVDARTDAKILAVLGSRHVLRRLNWQPRIVGGHQALRTYLERLRPGLDMFSVVHIIASQPNACDFNRRLSPLPGSVALDVDRRFRGWRLGITANMALRPSQPYELIDGVIVH